MLFYAAIFEMNRNCVPGCDKQTNPDVYSVFSLRLFSISSDPLVKQSDRKCIRILIDKSAFLRYVLSPIFCVVNPICFCFVFENVHLTYVLYHVILSLLFFFCNWIAIIYTQCVIIFASYY